MTDQQTLRSEALSQLLLAGTAMKMTKEEMSVVYQGMFVVTLVLLCGLIS